MKIQNLDLNLLRTMHALLEEQSVGRAARRLSLSQSAVSHALGKLRSHFNDPLLVKVQNGMALTMMAQELKIPLAEIMAKISDLAGDGRFDPAIEKAVFRISASDYVAGIVLPRLVEKLSTTAPHCSIECDTASRHLEHDLKLGFIDIAFGAYKPIANFSYETIFDERYIGVVRSGHPIFKQGICRDTIRSYPHAYIAATTYNTHKDELYQSLGIHKTDNIRVREPYFLVAPFIVEKSDLILIMPEMGARMMARLIDITVFELPTRIKTFPIIQIWQRQRDNDTVHQWFRLQVKEVCRKIKGFYSPSSANRLA